MLTSDGIKVGQATNVTVLPSITYHLARCILFTIIITQSRDHDSLFIKTEHEILIYDQQIEWMTPQNDRRRTKKQK